MKSINKCRKCYQYSLKEICLSCGSKIASCAPPKYSPDDKYGKYRRQVKLPAYEEAGLV